MHGPESKTSFHAQNVDTYSICMVAEAQLKNNSSKTYNRSDSLISFHWWKLKEHRLRDFDGSVAGSTILLRDIRLSC